jgi:hypothetical protein
VASRHWQLAAAIASAAVTAEALGARTAAKLCPLLRVTLGGFGLRVFLHVDVGLDALGALLAQRAVPELREASYGGRAARTGRRRQARPRRARPAARHARRGAHGRHLPLS